MCGIIRTSSLSFTRAADFFGLLDPRATRKSSTTSTAPRSTSLRVNALCSLKLPLTFVHKGLEYKGDPNFTVYCTLQQDSCEKSLVKRLLSVPLVDRWPASATPDTTQPSLPHESRSTSSIGSRLYTIMCAIHLGTPTRSRPTWRNDNTTTKRKRFQSTCRTNVQTSRHPARYSDHFRRGLGDTTTILTLPVSRWEDIRFTPERGVKFVNAFTRLQLASSTLWLWSQQQNPGT